MRAEAQRKLDAERAAALDHVEARHLLDQIRHGDVDVERLGNSESAQARNLEGEPPNVEIARPFGLHRIRDRRAFRTYLGPRLGSGSQRFLRHDDRATACDERKGAYLQVRQHNCL
jgi:hypothetical protein